MFETVRYAKVPGDVVEERDTSEQEDNEEDEEETIVYLQPLPGRRSGGNGGRRRRKLELCLRLAAALVLLAMVLGFVLCEWSRCAEEEANSGGHMAHTDKSGEGHDHHHHHHPGGEDGGDEVKEEEEKKAGDEDDDDHDHHKHHHHHTEDEDGDTYNEHKEEEEEEEKEPDEDDEDDHHDHDHHHHHHDSPDDSPVHQHTHSGSLFHNAAIITPSAVCSSAGRRLLQDGGNVVDAGIAALLCLGVVHPHTSGIGGTFSAVLYNHTSGSIKTIRATSPRSNLNFGLPAILPAVRCLHALYGRLEWARLFEEAIRLARDGFQIDGILASALLINERRIVQSKLCALFCDESGGVKPVGSNVTNQNLSEVLRGISLNESHFPEMLAMKLAGDLSPRERPDFVRDVRRVRGEINDPLIAKEEKYILLSGTRPFSGPGLSDALDRAAELIHSLHNRTDLNSSTPSILSLLNFSSEIYNATQAKEIGGISQGQAVNAASSQIGVMHSHGHILVISASLNSSWGSGLYLPSSGVLLSDFVSNVKAPLLNFPLVVKMKNMEDDDDGDDGGGDDDDEEDVQIVAVTGGLSAPLNAAQILTNRLERGMSAQDSVQKLPFRFAQRSATSVAVCTASSVSNGTDIFTLPQAERGALADGCLDDSSAMLLQLHAGHVGVYGSPALSAHVDGF